MVAGARWQRQADAEPETVRCSLTRRRQPAAGRKHDERRETDLMSGLPQNRAADGRRRSGETKRERLPAKCFSSRAARRPTFELSGARRNATRRGNAAPRVRSSAGLGSDRIEAGMVESEAAHARRILRRRAARNTNPARCRGDGRGGWMVVPRTRQAGDGSMSANATLATRDR